MEAALAGPCVVRGSTWPLHASAPAMAPCSAVNASLRGSRRTKGLIMIGPGVSNLHARREARENALPR